MTGWVEGAQVSQARWTFELAAGCTEAISRRLKEKREKEEEEEGRERQRGKRISLQGSWAKGVR